MDQVLFQLLFPLEVSTWGQMLALPCPSLLCVSIFQIIKGKRIERKKKITSSLTNQTRKRTRQQRGLGPVKRAGPGSEAAGRPAGAKARRRRRRHVPDARSPLLTLVAAELGSWPAPRGSAAPAQGRPGRGGKFTAAGAGGLLSESGGSWTRAGRRAAGRGSECAGRRARRSVASRARPGPARRRRRGRRPRGGGAAEGGAARGRRASRGGSASGSVAQGRSPPVPAGPRLGWGAPRCVPRFGPRSSVGIAGSPLCRRRPPPPASPGRLQAPGSAPSLAAPGRASARRPLAGGLGSLRGPRRAA